MNDYLSTREVGWVIGESAATVRRMIRDGDVAGSRVVGGFRVPRDEVLRLGRETVEAKAGRKLSDRELERLIDEVLATNEAEVADAAAAPMKPTSQKRRRRG
jgi:hypothetical protein